jgi:hypothetical protein
MDFIFVKVKNRQIKRYAAFCGECRISRGYKDKNKIDALCYKCSNTKINKSKIGQPKSELTKKRMSISALNRGKNNVKKQIARNSNRTYIKSRTDLQIKLSRNMRSLLNVKLKNRNMSKFGQKTFNLVGYTVDDLIKHIEINFKPGMTWENRSKWHIDHVIPDSWFTYESTDSINFKKCWSLDNLMPCWAKDNLVKGNRYSGDASGTSSK